MAMGQVSKRFRLSFVVLDEDAEACLDIDLAPGDLPGASVDGHGAIPVQLTVTDRQGVTRTVQAEARPV